MDFPEILCGNIFNFGHMFISLKYSDSDPKWMFTPIISIIVVIELLIIFNFSKIKKKIITFNTIVESDKIGCWVIILLPMIINYHKSYSDFTILIVGSLCSLALKCYIYNIYIELFLLIGLCFFILYVMSSYCNLLNLVNPISLMLILSKVLPSFFINLLTLGESIMLSQIICLFMLNSLYFTIFIIYYLCLRRLTFPYQPFSATMVITFNFLILSYFCCKLFNKNVFDDFYSLMISLISMKNLLLILLWSILLAGCIGLVVLIKSFSDKSEEEKIKRASILHLRKVFHFGASLVFASGIMYNAKDLLITCSVALLISMILFEHIREKQIGILGQYLQSILSPFFDKRDNGVVSLSPISLLCGLAMPIWVMSLYENNFSKYDQFWMWSGIITVGIGDSFGALIGRKWGRYYWNRKIKGRTLEGSMACFISQLLVSYIIFVWLQIPLNCAFAQNVFVALIITTFVEAHTEQLDNFILPLVFYSFR